MSSLISWFLTSSSDPNQVGLTVRGVLILIVPLLAHFFGVDDTTANGIVDGIVQLTVAAFTFIGVAMTLFGMLRKFYLGRWAHPAAGV